MKNRAMVMEDHVNPIHELNAKREDMFLSKGES